MPFVGETPVDHSYASVAAVGMEPSTTTRLASNQLEPRSKPSNVSDRAKR
jgi:hypothetical protein